MTEKNASLITRYPDIEQLNPDSEVVKRLLAETALPTNSLADRLHTAWWEPPGCHHFLSEPYWF